jgi:hypothetical protein
MPPVPKPCRLKDKGAIKAVRKDFCEWCGTPRGPFEVHHVKSKGAGNPDHPYNLICLCHSCHQFKAHQGAIKGWQFFEVVARREGVNVEEVRRVVRELKA